MTSTLTSKEYQSYQSSTAALRELSLDRLCPSLQATAIEVLSDGNLVFRKIANHLSKVASPFVRNTATIGGNIIMAQRLPFESDIATVLLAAGTTVTIQTASKKVVPYFGGVLAAVSM